MSYCYEKVALHIIQGEKASKMEVYHYLLMCDKALKRFLLTLCDPTKGTVVV
jgi:hypothetical protein